MSEDEGGSIENNVIGSDNDKDEISHSSPHLENRSKINSREKRTRSEPKRKKMSGKFARKETDRAIFNAMRGLRFEVHFKLINEPHILLAQIAEMTAKKVYIQSFGKIDQCQMIDCSESQVFYYGEDPKKRKSPSDKYQIPALHTAGVDFGAFGRWKNTLMSGTSRQDVF
ncbi:hypothetical protein CRYUN_Cryun17cG0000200 [Craigia yunnanensis]